MRASMFYNLQRKDSWTSHERRSLWSALIWYNLRWSNLHCTLNPYTNYTETTVTNTMNILVD